jgi:sulfur carrier protein
MFLHINGEQRDFPDGLTVAALVAQLGMKPDRVAVELNLEIVSRAQWETPRSKMVTGSRSSISSAAGTRYVDWAALSFLTSPTLLLSSSGRIFPVDFLDTAPKIDQTFIWGNVLNISYTKWTSVLHRRKW